MKKILVSVFAVAVALYGGVALASGEAESNNDRFVGKNCPEASLSLPERIAKLRAEITKGEKVYTPEELKRLELLFEEDKQTVDYLQRGGH